MIKKIKNFITLAISYTIPFLMVFGICFMCFGIALNLENKLKIIELNQTIIMGLNDKIDRMEKVNRGQSIAINKNIKNITGQHEINKLMIQFIDDYSRDPFMIRDFNYKLKGNN